VPDPFAWHPEPELIGFRDVEARAALEELGRATWAEALDWLYGEAMRRPVAAEGYEALRRAFYGPSNDPAGPPDGGAPSADVLAEFRERIAPHLYAAQHPGSYSYFTPPPLPMSIAGEVLSQWVNQGVDIFQAGPVAAFVEEEVTTWLRRLVGFDDAGWGVLTSGGVMANIMAMTVARDIHLARVLKVADPPRGGALEGARVYASDQTHFSIARALDLLGFAPEALSVLPSDDRFRLHGDVVRGAVVRDRAAGLVPFAIAAVSGSTNTGSVDLVGQLADVAEAEGLWLHVDAAYGGAARLSQRHAPRVPDLERADSVTVDPHKWFFQAYDVGALIVRRREDLIQTFHREPEYYRHPRPEEAPLHWYQYSLEGTRRFRALKLWLSWKHLGTRGLGRLVEHNVELAAHLARVCEEADDFEVVPPQPELSVVCFRHVPARLRGEELDDHQDRLQQALAASGEGWVSTTTLRDRRYLRAGVLNYLSMPADADRIVETLRRLSPSVR
jgi:glutamate/tyrosine decarboxylase-like PLP-dependent enzyme